jgi:hypothetical protein
VSDKLVEGEILLSDGGNAPSIHGWYDISRGVLVRDDQCKVMSLSEDMVKLKDMLVFEDILKTAA